ncbi:MAG: phosphoribosylamine--glycine ligase [delta proteobacterium ML8_D]|nr:MAG: phosphoribosylamine--glycine ligase [delta proteobacterium ML8_D]
MHRKTILVIGSGGREHALCWKLASSPKVSRVFCAPGNAGISQHAVCVPLKVCDIDGLVSFVKKEGIDITLVGPEAPLAEGLVDKFNEHGLAVFGPTKAAAEIEASKVFSKDLLTDAGIRTGAYRVFAEPNAALDYIKDVAGVPIVIKADGLAAGKGVLLAHSLADAEEAIDLILRKKAFGKAGNRLIIEEFLTGEEASFMAITDGTTVLPLATSQDHKPVFDDDKGPNTGGMGAYSPAPVVSGDLFQDIMDAVMRPTVEAMARIKRPYQGVLYGGIIIKDGISKVLEFNCRFGDPEAQPILMRLRTDLMEVIEAALEGRLNEVRLEWDPRAAVCVVMASAGYPGSYETGKVIHGLGKVAEMQDVMVFHAGTAKDRGRFVTSGGRVLGVTALGDTIPEAIDLAYKAVDQISWEGMHYRRDIGQKALRYMSSESNKSVSSHFGNSAKVGIVMGSLSDQEVMGAARDILNDFGIACELKVASAHRSPELTAKYAKHAGKRGIKVLIAGAGMAAHLAGSLAANTILPVIGVPIDSSALNGLDALLSTVQMPPGVPVATVAIGEAGAKNAALLALQILALEDQDIARKLKEYRESQVRKIEETKSEIKNLVEIK